jgi:copper(I)-binding protein
MKDAIIESLVSTKLWEIIMRTFLVAFAFLATSFNFSVAKDDAMAVTAGDLTISKAWSRATPANAKAGAGYLMIKNAGETDNVLLSAESDIADKTEIHTMSVNDGVMTMREVESGVVIPAGESVEFKPGGFHIMLIGLKSPLEEGKMVPVTLNFANGEQVEVMLNVAGMGAKMAPDHKH